MQKGGYGFFAAMEKHLKTELHQGRVTFKELEAILENILPANIGSNEFHTELEKFILHNFETNNLQNFTKLIKALSLYQFKLPELEKLIYEAIGEHINDFTINQL